MPGVPKTPMPPLHIRLQMDQMNAKLQHHHLDYHYYHYHHVKPTKGPPSPPRPPPPPPRLIPPMPPMPPMPPIPLSPSPFCVSPGPPSLVAHHPTKARPLFRSIFHFPRSMPHAPMLHALMLSGFGVFRSEHVRFLQASNHAP